MVRDYHIATKAAAQLDPSHNQSQLHQKKAKIKKRFRNHCFHSRDEEVNTPLTIR
jgi:hypothetical protein